MLHEEPKEFFCSVCEVTVCVVCICSPQHEAHSEAIVDQETGLETFKLEIEKHYANVTEFAALLEFGKKIVESQIVGLKNSQEKIEVMRKELEYKLQLVEENIQKVAELEEPLLDLSRKIDEYSRNLLRLQHQEIGESIDMTDVKINQWKIWKQQMEELISLITSAMEMKYKMAHYFCSKPGRKSTKYQYVGKVKIQETTLKTIYRKAKEKQMQIVAKTRCRNEDPVAHLNLPDDSDEEDIILKDNHLYEYYQRECDWLESLVKPKMRKRKNKFKLC